MTADLPDHYFRVRENGAAVFRLSTENRQRRIEMDEIATVNVRSGNIKPHGDAVLSPADLAAIKGWLSSRQAQLDAVTDALLLAMHDLRTVLVRKKAERLGQTQG